MVIEAEETIKANGKRGSMQSNQTHSRDCDDDKEQGQGLHSAGTKSIAATLNFDG